MIIINDLYTLFDWILTIFDREEGARVEGVPLTISSLIASGQFQ